MSNFVPDYGKIQLERPRRDAAGEYELGLDVAPCQGCYGWRCGHAVCAHRFAHFRRDGAVLGSVAVSKTGARAAARHAASVCRVASCYSVQSGKFHLWGQTVVACRCVDNHHEYAFVGNASCRRIPS